MYEVTLAHRIVYKCGPERIGPREEYSISSSELQAYLQVRKGWKSTLPEDCLPSANRRYFLLTFDDGYRNNLTEAVPVLERFDVHAIIFITTGFVDGEMYPYELEMASAIQGHDALHISSDSPPVEVHTREAEETLYQQLRQPLKAESHAKREAFMKELADLNGYDRHCFQDEPFLSWQDIVELDRHPLITIGAHTETHPVLTRRFPWVAYREMRASKRKLEQVLSHDVVHFSYPYGRNNAIVRWLARRVGFRWAFTTENHRIDNIDTCNPMALPRVDIQHLVQAHSTSEATDHEA